MAARSYFAGVDVGGTTVTTQLVAQLVDGQLRPVHETTVATDTSSPDATLESIAHGIDLTLREAQVTHGNWPASAWACPARWIPVNCVSVMAVNLFWYGYPVGARLRERFGVPIALENDVRAAALGVYQFDNPANGQDLVYVSIGTGVAAGIILNGQLLHGRNNLAGEVGHFIVDPDGPPCNCGVRGCLETLVSATAVIRMARAAVSAGAAYQPGRLRAAQCQGRLRCGGGRRRRRAADRRRCWHQARDCLAQRYHGL